MAARWYRTWPARPGLAQPPWCWWPTAPLASPPRLWPRWPAHDAGEIAGIYAAGPTTTEGRHHPMTLTALCPHCGQTWHPAFAYSLADGTCPPCYTASMAAHGTAFDAIAPAGLMAQIADDGGAMTKAMAAGKAAADRTLAARADGATAEAAARAGKGEAAVEALARSERVSVCGDAEARARDAWADWWNATGPHDDVGDGEAAGLQDKAGRAGWKAAWDAYGAARAAGASIADARAAALAAGEGGAP